MSHRAVSGGYNLGCLIVMQPRGVVIKGLHDRAVPPGAIAAKKDIVQTRCALCSLESVCFSQDQIAVGHGSAAYIAVVWSLNGLVRRCRSAGRVKNHGIFFWCVSPRAESRIGGGGMGLQLPNQNMDSVWPTRRR